MALNFTLLTAKETTDSPEQLQVLREKEYGPFAAPSDLSILLGADVYDGATTGDGELSTLAWTKTSNGKGRAICAMGDETTAYHPGWSASVRPVLPKTETGKIRPDTFPDLSARLKTIVLGEAQKFHSCDFGDYPQTITNERTSTQLEKLFQGKSLQTTGKDYTFPVYESSFMSDVRSVSCDEYEYKGKKYIRFPGIDTSEEYASKLLASGKHIDVREPQWVEVQPIEWLMDKSGAWVSKKCLFTTLLNPKGGYEGNYYGDLEKTFLGNFLNTQFAKDIQTPEWEARIQEKGNEPPKPTEKNHKKFGISKILTLERKSEELDKASKEEREAREAAVEKAVKSGKKRSEINVQDLRDAEGRARGKKLAEILKNKSR